MRSLFGWFKRRAPEPEFHEEVAKLLKVLKDAGVESFAAGGVAVRWPAGGVAPAPATLEHVDLDRQVDPAVAAARHLRGVFGAAKGRL